MSERRAGTKGRRLGSSRRKQLQEGPGQAPGPAPSHGEEPPWASEIVQRVQRLLSHRDTEQAAVVTRSDMQKLQEEGLPCSREELELVFDGLDAAGTGRLGTEEFTAGLRQFLSSQNAAREHRRRKTASRRVRLVLPGAEMERGDSEERRHFTAFMEQLGTGNPSEEQEIWQLWVKLRQDEPQLLDNLEGFLAKMRQRIQEARSEKEALELTLNKRVAEHDKDVQQLCEVLERQIQQEQLRLQQQSTARSQQQGEELQRVLDASEREVQRLVTAQMELERRCHSLHSSQQVTSTENQQLQESNQALQQHLQHLHQQLQQTQGHLRTMRATVAWEHMGEPGGRVVAELPIEVPVSPQLSPGKSEKFRSEMRIRLGSQSSESKAKSTHQVVWEMLPAETNLSGAPRKASSAEEDPFPEPLKEEGVSDQSSLLREMNDAIAALSKHLKAQALGAPPALADTACHPWDNAEAHTGPEAATAHETTPGVLQETLPGHIHHELLEGDLQEGPATAELRAPDVTQAGASAGAGHCMAQEPGAEQGESPEEAQRMLFQQGKGAGVEEMVLNVAEHLGESTEAGEQVLLEVEGAEWLQEKTAWAKPQLLGEAEEGEINQRENLEASLGPPEAGQEGVAVGQCLAMDEQQPGRTMGECVQAPGTALQERADPASGLPGKLETELGEQLEPEPPSWGEAQVGAAHGGGVPEVTVAPDPGVPDEEHARTEVQPQGETTDSKVLEVLPARAERAGSGRAGGEEEEVEEAEPREAEQQLQGECAREGAGWRGRVGVLEPLAVAVPPTRGQRGGGTDVELMEAPSSTNVELLTEVEADLQVWNEDGSPGTQRGGGVAPGVQLEKDNPEAGLGEELGAAAVHSEGPSPAGTPVGSPDLCGLFPGTSQALVEAQLQLSGGLSPENAQGGKGERAVQLQENEEEDGAQGQGEHGLSHKPVPHPSGVILGQGEGAGAGLQPGENDESLDTVEDQSSGANVQLIAEGGELRLTPGGSTEADLQPWGEAGFSGIGQGGSVDPEVHSLDQEEKEDILERKAEDAQEDMMFHEGPSPGGPWREEGERAVQLEEEEEEEEDGAQRQGEGELPHEPELDLHGSGVRQGEGAGEDLQAQEEAESLHTTEAQSSGANVQLIAEGGELRLTPGGSTEADLQPWGEAGCSGREQGGRLDPEVQPLDQVNTEDILEMEVEDVQEDVMELLAEVEADVQVWNEAGPSGTEHGGSVDSEMHPLDEGNKAELVEGEAEDAQADLQLSEGLSSGVPREGETGTNAQMEEKDNEAQGQGEYELSHGPVLDLHGSGVRQGEGAGEDMQAQEEAESLDTVEDQSSGANVQLIAEGGELRLTPGGSTEADLQPWGEAGSLGTVQGGRLDPEVQPLDQGDKAELVEEEAEDAQTLQLSEARSSGVPRGGEIETNAQMEEEEDGAQRQGEGELPHEPELDLHGSGVRQGEGAGEDMQAQEEAESLHTTEAQSSGANVQLIAEGGELKSASGESTEADLQPLIQTDSMATEQGGSVDPEVHPLDQGDEAEVVERKAEHSWTDTQLCVTASPETPQGGEHCAALQPRDGDGDWGQGQGGRGQMQELVPDPSGVTIRQRRGTEAGVQPVEEAESLDTVEDQSSGANVQLIAEGGELRLTPGGSTEADLQPWGEAGSSGREQGGRLDPEVQPLDQGDKAELVEEEAEDAQTLQLSEGLSSGVPRGGEIETNVQMEEEEDGAQRQGEDELPHEPELDLHGSGVRQGEGAGEDLQAQEEAESLHTTEAQSSGANVQLIAEGGEPKSASGESTEADLQPLIQTDSMGTEQGGSVDPDVHPLDQGDEAQFLKRKAEDAQEDMMFHEGPSPEGPWRGEGERAVQLEEEEEDGAQGQGEGELPHEPELDLHGSGVRQGEGAGEDMQAQEEAESLDTVEDQSSDANVQLIAEGDELRLTPGGSTEADLQPWGEAGSSGREQGGSVDPEVQPLDQVNKEDILEMQVVDAQADLQLCVGPSSETLWGRERGIAVQIEEEEDGAQGQGEHGLPHEPVPHPSGVILGQGEGAGAGLQPGENDESLDTVEDQSSGANVQLIAEGDELRLTPGWSTEADLQPWGEAGSSGTDQGGSVDPEVQPLHQGEKEEFLERKAEDAQEDMMFHEGPSPGGPWGGEGERAVQLEEEEEEDEAQGQGEYELPHEPELDLHGSGVRQGEGAGEDMQAQEEAESLHTTEAQSSGANVQLIAEGGELRLTPGGSTEADLQPWGEAGSSGREQGGSVDPDVHPLDQGDKAELVGGEAEDAQGDLQLSEGLSSGAPWGEEWRRALQNEEEEEGGAQVQGENRLPQEPVLAPEGAGSQQGEGAVAGAQTQDEAERLHTLEAKSTDADVQLFTDQQMPKSGSGGSMEADLTPLGVAGLWEGEQSLTLGLEAVLGASPTAKPWEGAAAADVPPPAEAAVCPEPTTAAESSGLEAKLGACIGPEGQILEAQELLQGEGAAAEEKALGGAHGLELAQGERLEAGVRDGVKTQGLGLNQGHDDAELASLVSEVLSQLSPLKLETMMQEDVLIPDVWRLCAPGQAAQRELQEQVSAQGHEGRLHTVAQHPEGETPPARELENTAAGPAEHPKQEVPPASTLHKAVPPGDAGSDQLGGVLRENSLGQRQLLGEQSKDLSVGQREKMQEFGQKMSQEGEPSSGEPGAVTAGAAPQGGPKAALDPDHLYNVLFVGDSHVGKTSFLYRLHADTFNPHLTATVGLDYQIKNLVVDNKRFALRLWDSAGQERYRSMTKQFFRKADGVVLMYDITSEYSFSDVRYWLSCIQEGAEDGVAVLLLGNKTDCAAQRQVPTKEGECLAKEHQLMFFECSAASGHNVFESMVSFTRLLKVREDELKNKAEEVPKVPEKKKSCCW